MFVCTLFSKVSKFEYDQIYVNNLINTIVTVLMNDVHNYFIKKKMKSWVDIKIMNSG